MRGAGATPHALGPWLDNAAGAVLNYPVPPRVVPPGEVPAADELLTKPPILLIALLPYRTPPPGDQNLRGHGVADVRPHPRSTLILRWTRMLPRIVAIAG